MSKKIFLSGKAGHGKFALVDDTDYEKLSAYQWHLTAGKYAGSDAAGGTMHRIILKTFDGLPLVRKYYIDELSGGKK